MNAFKLQIKILHRTGKNCFGTILSRAGKRDPMENIDCRVFQIMLGSTFIRGDIVYWKNTRFSSDPSPEGVNCLSIGKQVSIDVGSQLLINLSNQENLRLYISLLKKAGVWMIIMEERIAVVVEGRDSISLEINEKDITNWSLTPKMRAFQGLKKPFQGLKIILYIFNI